MRHAMRPLCLLLLVAAPVPAAAQSLDPEALKLISDTAASICGDFAKLEGSESDASLEGAAQAKLAGLAGKLVNLGVEGAGKITDSEYVGVLREAATSSRTSAPAGCRCGRTCRPRCSPSRPRRRRPRPLRRRSPRQRRSSRWRAFLIGTLTPDDAQRDLRAAG